MPTTFNTRVALIRMQSNYKEAGYQLQKALEHNEWCSTNSPANSISPHHPHNREAFSEDEIKVLEGKVSRLLADIEALAAH